MLTGKSRKRGNAEGIINSIRGLDCGLDVDEVLNSVPGHVVTPPSRVWLAGAPTLHELKSVNCNYTFMRHLIFPSEVLPSK